MNLAKLFVLPVASLLVATLAQSARAQECGMGEVDWYSAERATVARADELLQQGEAKKAAVLVQKMWPRMREATPNASTLPAIADGVRVMALAAVRADGDVGSSSGWSSWTAGERASNVAWGVSRLRMLARLNPWDTLVMTNLGEALSRSPATREEAIAILDTLDTNDQIASPEGFAALALVKSELGDTVGAQNASTMCERRATNVSVQCTAAGARVTPSEPAITAAR